MSEYPDWLPADEVRMKETVKFMNGGAGRILDIGMKYGFTLEAVFGLEKVGIDTNPVYLETVKKRGIIKDARLCDVHKMPFEDKIFDCIIFTEVLEHIEKPDEAIAEISRVCRGRLILSTPNNCWARRVKHFLLRKPNFISPQHVREYSWKEVKVMVERHGFKLTRFRGLGFFLTYRPYPFWEPFGRLFPWLSADMLMEFEKDV